MSRFDDDVTLLFTEQTVPHIALISIESTDDGGFVGKFGVFDKMLDSAKPNIIIPIHCKAQSGGYGEREKALWRALSSIWAKMAIGESAD